MIKRLWCWLTGHKFVLFVYVTDGMITIHNKDTATICKELGRCRVCGYVEGDNADGVSWTGHLNYVQFSKGIFEIYGKKDGL